MRGTRVKTTETHKIYLPLEVGEDVQIRLCVDLKSDHYGDVELVNNKARLSPFELGSLARVAEIVEAEAEEMLKNRNVSAMRQFVGRRLTNVVPCEGGGDGFVLIFDNLRVKVEGWEHQGQAGVDLEITEEGK